MILVLTMLVVVCFERARGKLRFERIITTFVSTFQLIIERMFTQFNSQSILKLKTRGRAKYDESKSWRCMRIRQHVHIIRKFSFCFDHSRYLFLQRLRYVSAMFEACWFSRKHTKIFFRITTYIFKNFPLK